MEIKKVDKVVSHTITFTDDELKALRDTLGNTSHTFRVSKGVSELRSRMISNIYSDLDDHLGG